MEESEVRAVVRESIAKLAESETSKAAFARKVGATPQTVNHWLNGGMMPPLDVLVRIADAYGLSLDALLGRGGQRDLFPDEAEVVGIMRSMNGNGSKMLVTVAKAFKASGSYDS